MKGYTIQHSIELLEKKVGSGSGGGSTAADITYDNTSSGLTADDVQEAIDEIEEDVVAIKAGTTYTTDERKIGVWYDGNDLYEKIIPIDAFPSTAYTTGSYPHGITGIVKIVDITGIMNFDSGAAYPVNLCQFTGSGNTVNLSIASLTCYADKTNVNIMTGVDRSGASGYVKLLYTKASTNNRSKKKK